MGNAKGLYGYPSGEQEGRCVTIGKPCFAGEVHQLPQTPPWHPHTNFYCFLPSTAWF